MSLKNINTSPKFTRYLITERAFEKKPLVTVDVGARGGFEKHWATYGDQIRLIGFEADTEECERLNQQGLGPGKRFYPYALHQDKGRRNFYSTAYPASSSFYQPDMKELQRFPDRTNLTVVDTIPLETIDFDSFANENNIDHVDFIKLDAESAELDILKGAAGFLSKSVIGLSIEIWFQPWHLRQPVFSDVDSYLGGLGFRLYDLEVYRVSREALPEVTTSPIPGPSKRGQVISGEVLYLRDGTCEIENTNLPVDDWDEVRILKLASIMELFNLPDCAIELIQATQRKGLICDRDTNKLVDLLTPGERGKQVSYNAYLELVREAKQRGYTGNTQRAKSLLVRLLPRFACESIYTVLTKLRDMINGILE
jgi:FkbM family methyltransferase